MKNINAATIEMLVARGCEGFGWKAAELDRDAQLFAAECAVSDLIEEVGEDTATGRMWQRYERTILQERKQR